MPRPKNLDVRGGNVRSFRTTDTLQKHDDDTLGQQTWYRPLVRVKKFWQNKFYQNRINTRSERKKEKLNCVVYNLRCRQKQNRSNPKMLSILRQKISHETLSRVVSSTPLLRIRQAILSTWLALVICESSDNLSPSLYFSVEQQLQYTVKER